MKLSEKGLKKFEVAIFETEEYGISSGYGYDNGVTVFQLEGHEFEPDDFKGVVVLTLEEAQEISFQLYSLAMLYDTMILELDPDKSLIKRVGKSYEPLNKKISQARKTMRIKQAEKQK